MSVVSGDTVKEDIEALSGYLDKFESQATNFSGSWEGTSYEAFAKAAKEFKTDCEKISKGMEAFAKACDTYNNDYLAKKRKKEDLVAKRNDLASRNTDNIFKDDIDRYDNEISTYENNMEKYKEDIVRKLDEAASYKIDGATAFSAGAPGSLSLTPTNINDGSYMLLNCDLNAVGKKFGSQLDNNGVYGADGSGCDDYARAYAIYAQTGIVPSKASVSVSDNKSGLQSHQISAKNRKEQAEIAYDLLVNKGKPSVIHVNSPSTGSGQGHWVTVVGCKKGVTKDTVKVDDLIILDPVTGTVRAMTEDKEYCRTDLGRCKYQGGYHINYYA